MQLSFEPNPSFRLEIYLIVRAITRKGRVCNLFFTPMLLDVSLDESESRNNNFTQRAFVS